MLHRAPLQLNLIAPESRKVSRKRIIDVGTWITSVRHSLTASHVLFLFFVAAILFCLNFADTAFEQIDGAVEEIPAVSALSQFATTAGGRVGGTMLVLALLLIARQGRKRLALTLLCGFSVQTGLTQALKHLTGRPRPVQFDDCTIFFGPGYDYHSFPSGHASFAFLMATIVAAYYPRWRWVAYALATVVAFGRVMLDRHFLSDVMVGGLVGYLAAWVFLRVWPPLRHTDAYPEPGDSVGSKSAQVCS